MRITLASLLVLALPTTAAAQDPFVRIHVVDVAKLTVS